jgi:dihydropteroate synthase
VLNCTPDSFSDGGLYLDREKAAERVFQLVEEGADIVDIGGESTRPGSGPTPLSEELRRVIPVVESTASKISAVISVDTRKSAVAREAFEAGASLLNDISSLSSDPEMTDVVAEYDAPVVLMHMKGTPKDMQEHSSYSDLMGEITSYLQERLAFCCSRGIEKTLVDPGIGFAKQLDHNLRILKNLSELRSLGRPILVGTSRKSFIGSVLDLPVGERLEGTLASIAVAILNGANVVRVHEVKQAVRVARMVDSLK